MILHAVAVDNLQPARRYPLEAEGRLVIDAEAVEGWGDGSLVISVDDQTRQIHLHASGLDHDLRIGDEPVPPDTDVPLRSGDEIHLGEQWSLRFFVRFQHTGIGRRIGLLPLLVLAAILVMICFQLGIGIWLPMTMRQHTRDGTEIARQRTLQLVDNMRRAVGEQANSELDMTTRVTIALVGEELDRMAAWLRAHEEDLDARQINQIFDDLQALLSILRRLMTHSLYPPNQGLDTETAIRDILNVQEELPAP